MAISISRERRERERVRERETGRVGGEARGGGERKLSAELVPPCQCQPVSPLPTHGQLSPLCDMALAACCLRTWAELFLTTVMLQIH